MKKLYKYSIICGMSILSAIGFARNKIVQELNKIKGKIENRIKTETGSMEIINSIIRNKSVDHVSDDKLVNLFNSATVKTAIKAWITFYCTKMTNNKKLDIYNSIYGFFQEESYKTVSKIISQRFDNMSAQNQRQLCKNIKKILEGTDVSFFLSKLDNDLHGDLSSERNNWQNCIDILIQDENYNKLKSKLHDTYRKVIDKYEDKIRTIVQ